jgi:translocation protein SEC72
MAELDSFDLIHLSMDPKSKAISGASSPSRALEAELSQLNQLHRTLTTADFAPSVPPPPIPVNPKRTAAINRLRDSGNTEFRKNNFAEAIRHYTVGLQMALTRAPWEPQQLVREEVATLYSNRAQAHMAMQAWPEGAVDADASVEARKIGNAKAWWRRGKCLMEMGRYDEAREWVGRGLEMEGTEADLVALLKEIDGRIAKGEH